MWRGGGRAGTGRALWACVCVVCLVFTPSPGGWGHGRQTRGSQPLQLSSEREACRSARGGQPKVRPSLRVLAKGRGQDRNSRHRPKRAEACAAKDGRRRRPEAGGWAGDHSPSLLSRGSPKRPGWETCCVSWAEPPVPRAALNVKPGPAVIPLAPSARALAVTRSPQPRSATVPGTRPQRS